MKRERLLARQCTDRVSNSLGKTNARWRSLPFYTNSCNGRGKKENDTKDTRRDIS